MVFSVRITNAIVKDQPLVEGTANFFPRLERAIVLLLGLYVAYQALGDIVYQASYNHRMYKIPGNDHSKNPERHAKFVQAAVELIFAMFLILGAGAIVKG